TGTVVVAEVHLSPGWVGHRVSRLEEAARVRVAALTRLGRALVPNADTVLQEGDLAHVALAVTDLAKVEGIFAKGPEH
ncbi:MAG: TrkA C-terminal domain-containing protein, partial [Actinocrinis sp.]